ncbi:MAG: glycosyl hydrolase [Proteobacteria bacterium]|nr:glycosyl hydrolase [Pseudomonadota bacterium]
MGSSFSPAAIVLCAVFSLVPHGAQAARKDPVSVEPTRVERQVAEKDRKRDKVYGALSYRLIGPAVGGRITRVYGVAGDPKTYYLAAAQGGVWKSSNGGHDWTPLFDEQPTQSVGSLAVAASDPNVIYVGSGEANIRGNVAIGTGIFKSTDAGKTWTQVWSTRGQIGTLVIHPGNPDIAYAAVLGSPFGPNAERGVYRTVDGGHSWQRVLYKNSDTGASDIAMDPSNPRILLAGLWQARRTPWSMTSGGPGSGLYRSVDGGDHWTQIAGDDFPKDTVGKVGVAFAPSDSHRAYALIEAEKGGLFRSDDNGETWSLVNESNTLSQRAWYYSTITVDPHDPDTVYFPQVNLLRSIDGGKTVQSIQDKLHHGDNHDLWIDPRDPLRMIDGNDGGVDVTTDGGKTWSSPPLPLAQFYNIDVDNRVPYHVGGTMQDWGTASGPSRALNESGNVPGLWLHVGGGEAGDFVYDPTETGHIYAGEYGGYLSHYVEGSAQNRNISVYPFDPSGHGAVDLKYRFQWTAPLATSPHDPKVLYHGANVLFRTRDRGVTWEQISPDLTRDDKSKQQWSGGPITGDNTGVEVYDTIFAIAESPLAAGTIWAGSDDGLVSITRDNGANWSTVTPPGLPAWAKVECITPSDPEDPNFVYLGTEHGMYISRDSGASFEPLKLNLPAVAVTDIETRHGDLVLGTRGRGIWVLEDLAALREATPAARNSDLQLFSSKPAYRFRNEYRWSEEGGLKDPPIGAQISYWLKSKPAGDLSLQIFDAQGRKVRTLSSVKKEAQYEADDPDQPTEAPEPELTKDAGFNRIVWDLRHDGARRLEKAKIDAGEPEVGPMVVPGRYTLKLMVGAPGSQQLTASRDIEVLADPRAGVSEADIRASVDFTLATRDAMNHTLDAIENVRAAREQADELGARLAQDRTQADLIAQAAALSKRCEAIEARLHNPKAEVVYDILAQKGGAQLYSQISFLSAATGAASSDYPPPQGSRERLAALDAEVAALSSEVQGLRTNEIARLEAALNAKGIPRILLPH